MSKMSTYGDFLLVGNTQPSLPMRVSSWDLLSLDHMRGSGRPGHRPNAVFSFGWWPTIGAGRQIALRVVGCLILSSALSVTRRMTINHLLVSCVFARQFWYLLLRQVGLHSFSPQPSDTSFDSWWEKASGATSGLIQKGLNSLIVLGAWTLWNHRNRCIFYGITPNHGGALTLAGEERQLWNLAGAKGLSSLTAPLFGG